MWRTAARVSSENASVSDGIGNRDILSSFIWPHSAYTKAAMWPTSPPGAGLGPLPLGKVRAYSRSCGWRRVYPMPTAPTATERHYKRTFLPAPLGTLPVLRERQRHNGILR